MWLVFRGLPRRGGWTGPIYPWQGGGPATYTLTLALVGDADLGFTTQWTGTPPPVALSATAAVEAIGGLSLSDGVTLTGDAGLALDRVPRLPVTLGLDAGAGIATGTAMTAVAPTSLAAVATLVSLNPVDVQGEFWAARPAHGHTLVATAPHAVVVEGRPVMAVEVQGA